MLQDKIIQLFELVNQRPASRNEKEQIQDILEENNLDRPETVPAWFNEFIELLVQGKEQKKSFFQYDPDKGDISNFLAELEDIIGGEWNDYGEAVEIYFPTLQLKSVISIEDDSYTIQRKLS